MINQQQQTTVTNQQSAQQKQQLSVQKQFAMRKQQMDKAKMQAKQQGKLPVNAESLDAKIASLVSDKISTLSERADFWHPDPAQDRKLGGPGANQRAREDGAAASKSPSKSDNKLRPGESYMQFAKRKEAERTQKEEVGGGVKKGGSYDKGYAAMQKEIGKLEKGKEPATAKRYREMRQQTAMGEATRYEKETGKDYKTGKEVTKGGTLSGNDTNAKVMRHMHKVMGSGRMGSNGPIQPRGQKKDPGKKPPAAGEYGSGVKSPAQKLAAKRATIQQGKDNMSSRFD